MEDVLVYWFNGDKRRERDIWFYKKYDKEIEEKFRTKLEWFKGHLEANLEVLLINNNIKDCVGAIILVDQMAKNIYRNTSKAYEYQDEIAEFAKTVLERLIKIDDKYLSFILICIMHQENLENKELVDLGLFLFNSDKYAAKMQKSMKAHYNVLEKFGRYPKRNIALGRITTEQEQKYLDECGKKFV